MKVMLLIAGDYYTQRNNPYKPLSACMPTSRIMWYQANRIGVREGERIVYHRDGVEHALVLNTEKADNQFMVLLQSDEAAGFCREKYPWTANRKDEQGTPLPDIRPNEVHGMYGAWLDERVTGRRRSDFRTDLSWEEYFDYLDHGYAVMTSGRFPTTRGHAVVAAGFDTDRPLLYLADPYGNHRTGYEDPRGYGIPLDRDEFEEIINGSDAGKWGHVPYGLNI